MRGSGKVRSMITTPTYSPTMPSPNTPTMLIQNIGNGRKLYVFYTPKNITVSIMGKEAMTEIAIFDGEAYGGPLFFVQCLERGLAGHILAGWRRLRCERLVSRQVYVRVRELICASLRSNLGKRAIRHQITRASSAAMAKVMEAKWVKGK